MTVFFTADHHFGHAAILKMCGRPFAGLTEHDHGLIEAWNSVVQPDDEVWHLGDFAYKQSPKLIRKIFDQLNGRKHLVYGNHDWKGPGRQTGVEQLPWASQQSYAETTVEGQRLILFHYAMRVWPGMHRGSVHLYGHSHGRIPADWHSIDVGVDSVGYVPQTWPQIRERLEAIPPEDVVAGDPEDSA
jgi:calcineurin-like phosphoesterase family protein